MDSSQYNIIKEKAEVFLAERGLDMVDFKIFWQGPSWHLRMLIDYPGGGVTLNDCALINRLVCSLLEKEQLLGSDFTVEVHSPGTDRPLKELKDFLRARGQTVALWFEEPFEDKNYLEGVVVDIKDQLLVVMNNNVRYEIPLGVIHVAKQKVIV